MLSFGSMEVEMQILWSLFFKQMHSSSSDQRLEIVYPIVLLFILTKRYLYGLTNIY